jgi:hypothetical protein
MMMKFSFRPVCAAIDWFRSTCFSSLKPSGVSSNAQARNQYEWETEYKDDNERSENPIRRAEVFEVELGNLCNQPADDDLGMVRRLAF